MLFLYYFNLDYTTGAYYSMDIFTYFPICILVGYIATLDKFDGNHPHSNVFNSEILISIGGHIIISFFSFYIV